MALSDVIKKPKTKRGQATMDRILESAENLFYEKGYHNTSITDITSEADVALGTFYIYFKDKFSLYRYLLLGYNHDIRKAIASNIVEGDSRMEMERKGLKSYLEFVRANKHAYNIIWESLYIDKGLFMDYYEEFGRRYGKGLDEAKANGEARDLDTSVMSYVLMGVSTFLGLKYVMFQDEEEVDLDAVVDQVMSILEKGLFIRKK